MKINVLMIALFAFMLALWPTPGELSAADWPQWRGPNRDNVSSENGLLQQWPDGGPPRLWTAVGLGEGIASVSVAEGKIFTLGYQDESEFAVALNEKSGALGWATRIGPAVAEHSSMRWLTQRTPTVDGARVYATSAGGDLVCLTTRGGRELWRKSYTVDFGANRPTWGFCDSPLVDGERVICTPGGPQAKIVALDKLTGDVIWKSAIPGAENERAAYAALVVAEVGGLRQYVTFLSCGLVAVAAEDGRFLWRYDSVANGVGNSHTPLVRGDHIFCSSGWGKGFALLKLTRDGRNVAANEVYNNKLFLDGYQDCSALVGDNVYLSIDHGAAISLSLKTGDLAWKHLISGGGRMAVVSADGCLYYRHTNGTMTLAQPTPVEPVLRGTFSIPDHEPASGVTFPVIAGHRLYLRDNNRLHSYDIRADALKGPVTGHRVITLEVVAAAARTGPAPANAPRESRPARGVFVPTPHDVVKEMLDLARVKKTDVVYDLGSGDGRIVISAARDYGCKAIGYEIDPELVTLSREKARADDVEKLVTIEKADVFNVDVSAADVVTLYLLPQQNEKLVPQLKKLKPGSRIVSHQFEIPGMKPDKTVTLESKESGEKHTLFLYVLAPPS